MEHDPFRCLTGNCKHFDVNFFSFVITKITHCYVGIQRWSGKAGSHSTSISGYRMQLQEAVAFVALVQPVEEIPHVPRPITDERLWFSEIRSHARKGRTANANDLEKA